MYPGRRAANGTVDHPWQGEARTGILNNELYVGQTGLEIALRYLKTRTRVKRARGSSGKRLGHPRRPGASV
ncbi:hypothetical protein F2981_06250 [Sinorhizobium meliloti]|nr:hypothetical protein [Sinorhizobium meliloti]